MIPAAPSRHDPYTPTDWRWQRAGYLRAHGRYRRREQEDPFVKVARDFQIAQRAAHTDSAREKLARRYPGVYWADEIHRRALPEQRWTMEAFLLARERNAKIADYIKSSPEAVLWYEKLFFNVRPYLRHEMYIVNAVMGAAVHQGLSEREYDLLWKMIGFGMGPVALRQLILPMQPVWVADDDQWPAAVQTQADAQTSRKMLIGARTVPVWNNQQIIFDAYLRSRELERDQGRSAQGEALIAQNVQAALMALPFRVGAPAPASRLPYDETGAELRAGELVELALTGRSATAAEVLVHEFPEPNDGHSADVETVRSPDSPRR